MYLAAITDLSYDVYAVGKTKFECLNNLLIAFQRYIERYGCSVEDWVSSCGEDFTAYNRNVMTFLSTYYGYRLYDITKGYALGWE